VVTLLLDSRASIDRVVPGDENALIQASGAGQLSVVKLLVSHGADVNAPVWSNLIQCDQSASGERTEHGPERRTTSAVVDFLISAALATEWQWVSLNLFSFRESHVTSERRTGPTRQPAWVVVATGSQTQVEWQHPCHYCSGF